MSASTATRDRSGPSAVGGRSALRKEDPPLLTGAARFVDDVKRPEMAHAAILRSTHAHARVAAVDASAARAHPGVLEVVTATELAQGGPPIPMRMFPLPGMERFLQRPLACDVVRYSGEPIAVVVAESRYAAEDAAELVVVDYEPLEAVTRPERALDAQATVLHEHAGSNLAGTLLTDHGDVDRAFAEADVVVEQRIGCHRHTAAPLETRGLVAELDQTSGALTVWGAAKVVQINRRILARLLDWPEEKVRLVELSVGGGFGARGEFYPEDFLIPWCAIRLGRPVAWTEDREEHLRACNHSREQLTEIAIALRSDGTFVGLRARLLANTGAYVRTHGSVVPGMSAALLPGPYRWGSYRCQLQQVVTNKTPAGTYRAPGRYEANLARERVIDIAGRRLGIDPIELRRRNLVNVDEMPYATGGVADGHPVIYDSGDYALLLDKALDRLDVEATRSWRAGSAAGAHRRRGVGVAMFVEKSGIGGWEFARVSIQSTGRTLVEAGIASLGQGVDTVLAQICAERLGVPYDDVSVAHGDTASVPDGMGAFGSRATSLGGAAVYQAAGALRERILARAADRLGASAEEMELQGRRVCVGDDLGRSISLADLATDTLPPQALARGEQPGLAEETFFSMPSMSFPYGLHCAAVEVDVQTGSVEIDRYLVAYDVGRAINPMLVDGQIAGGVAQGVGGALLEELVYDDDGQLLAGSLMDYLLPTASEVPPIEVLLTEDAPSPLTPLGAKGAGEAGTAAAGAAIANAVSDALGAEVVELPLTPERVVELAREGRRT